MRNFEKQIESAIESSFKENVEFYHHGEIELTSEKLEKPTIVEVEDKIGVGFRLINENQKTQSFMLLVLDQGLDISLYIEMGNVFASRIASRSQTSEVILPTPPQLYREKQMKAVLNQFQLRKRFVHHFHGKHIPVDLLVSEIDPIQEGIA